jgi:glyoxylate/hydroxypyruvate reductase
VSILLSICACFSGLLISSLHFTACSPGRIGEAVAKRMRGFGCPIQYHGRSGRKEDFEAIVLGGAANDGAVSYSSLEELLSTCDFVVVLCALTPETRGLINYERLSLMKPDACLVNVSRGEVVDQNALIRILQERPHFSAGLDVTTPEPLPTDSPLLSLPNCVVVPHIGSATEECRTKMCEIAVANLLAGIDGKEMVAEVGETNGKFV